ncbi:MAG: sulfatase-like hydrolase/transferase [Verrucomicrobia bacterium]|nr:sulfatase-like hydrolase/transferase [Verrucomicrobiota bacterium]
MRHPHSAVCHSAVYLIVFCAALVPAAEKPNILLIMADDLGWGDVGFNGNKVIQTPQLDAMAKNGMKLTRFYTASPLCSPTRGSCLTGRYPWRFGVLAAHTGGMRMAETTVAEVAHLEKYQTGFFGKWHLGWVKPEEKLPRGFYSPPWQHGFDETFATTSAVPTWNPTITPAGKFSGEDEDKGEPSKEGSPWKGGKPYVHNGVEVSNNMEGDDARVIMDRVIPFIQTNAEKKQSFLACVWFHTPHEPVIAGPEYRKLYADNGSAKQNYFGAITAMDEQIGRLRTELRKLNIADNTILFFASDNGPADAAAKKGIASAGPFRGHKHTMFEGGLRVPALVEWPGHITAGSVSDAMCATVDYFPTIVELTGASLGKKTERPIDGISMIPVLTGKVTERATPLFFGYRRLYKDIDGQALIDNRYKLLKSAEPGGGYELYDLIADPAEANDLSISKPDILAAMKARMAEYDASCLRSRDGADYEF